MAFSKSFPRTSDKNVYPTWEEVFLTDKEEKDVEEEVKQENIKIIKECIDDAKKIIEEKGLKSYQSDVINMAVALFEKRASHHVYLKERKCKEKFDKQFSKK